MLVIAVIMVVVGIMMFAVGYVGQVAQETFSKKNKKTIDKYRKL